MIQTATTANNIHTALQNFRRLGNQISNPNEFADAEDIADYKKSASDAEINVAVLKKILDTKKIVDVIA